MHAYGRSGQSYAPKDIAHKLRFSRLCQVTAQAHFHDLGSRARTLNLPVMMAFVLSLIWRQIGSVCEAVRTRNREGLLWVDERKVWQQAIKQRFRSLSADLFK